MFVIIAIALSGTITAQSNTAAPDYKLLYRIISCRSAACAAAHKKDVHGKVEQTILYAKWVMAAPSSRTASLGLLESMPATEDELVAVMTLSDWHDGVTISTKQMMRMDAVYQRWPQLLATAVQRFPEYLPTYIGFGRLAVIDPNSNYTEFEEHVCRAHPKAFRAAFVSLDPRDQQFLRQHVFNPDNCTRIFVGEL